MGDLRSPKLTQVSPLLNQPSWFILSFSSGNKHKDTHCPLLTNNTDHVTIIISTGCLYLCCSPDPVVRLHTDEFARVVLPDGDLAGGGAVPATNLQHRVGRLDELPDCTVCCQLHVTVGSDKVLCEEVTLLI